MPLSKKKSWDWGIFSSSDDEIHHEEWPWDKLDDEEDENDESYGAEDYYTSRPWTDE